MFSHGTRGCKHPNETPRNWNFIWGSYCQAVVSTSHSLTWRVQQIHPYNDTNVFLNAYIKLPHVVEFVMFT